MAVTKNGGSGDDTPRRTDNADTLRGGSGDDTLYGRGADLLESASGSDRIFASSGRDDVYAGSSGDTFYADDGYRDYIDCGSGSTAYSVTTSIASWTASKDSSLDYREKGRSVTVPTLLVSNPI